MVLKKIGILAAVLLALASPALAVNPYPIAFGGTNATSFTLNQIIWFDGTRLTGVGPGTAYQVLRVPSGGPPATFGAIDISQSAAVAGILGKANGGFGLDMSSATGYDKWASGILSFVTLIPIADGGTNAASQTTNGVVFFDGSSITTDSIFSYSGGVVNVSTTNPEYRVTNGGSYARFRRSATTNTHTIDNVVYNRPAGFAINLNTSSNASESYAKTPNSTAINSFSAITVVAWIKQSRRPNAGGDAYIVSRSNNEIVMRVASPTGGFGSDFQIKNVAAGVGSATNCTPNVAPTLGVWHLFVGTWASGGPAKLYIDNVLCTATPGGNASTTVDNHAGLNDHPIYIGNSGQGSAQSSNFDGQIDEVRFYNVAWSATDVSNYWNGGAGLPLDSDTGLQIGYHFDDGTGTTAADINAASTITLSGANVPTWASPGHVPQPGSLTDDIEIQHTDGTAPGDHGTLDVGDPGGIGPRLHFHGGTSNVTLDSAGLDVKTNPILIELAPDATTGTGLNQTVILTTGAPTTATLATTGTTSGIVGICEANCGIYDSVQLPTSKIAISGIAPCLFDGATTAGHFVVTSTTTAGDCHDAGATTPSSSQNLGNVLSTNASGGVYNLQMAAGGGGSSFTAGTGLVISSGVINHSNSITPGSCGDATHSCGLTLDAQGHASAFSNNTISGSGSTNYYGSMVQLAQKFGDGSSPTISFTSIPAGYTDLIIILQGRDTKTATNQTVFIKLNSDGTAANYTGGAYVLGGGSGNATSGTLTANTNGIGMIGIPAASATANFASSNVVTIANYSGTSLFKKIQVTDADVCCSGSGERMFLTNSTWKSTAAISQIDLKTDGTAFTTSTIATLYGLGGASGLNPAVNGVNGALQQSVENHESLTLSGATTDTTGNILAAPGQIAIVNYRITTTITGSGVTGFQIGDASTATRFCGTQSTLTSGTTGSCIAHLGTSAVQQSSAAKVRVTGVGGSFSGGVIEIEVFAQTSTPPTS